MDAMSRSEYDLLIVVDSTGSMSTYLAALQQALPQILSVSTLTGCFARIGLIAYRDYDCNPKRIVSWSGWHDAVVENDSDAEPVKLAKSLWPESHSPADWAEAARTGLAKAYEQMRDETETIVLLYADAPPHMPAADGRADSRNRKMELTTLRNAPGDHSRLFMDWHSACTAIADKGGRVFSFFEGDDLGCFHYLSTVTNGFFVQVEHYCKARRISELTLAALLSWMRVDKTGTGMSPGLTEMHEYGDCSSLKNVTDEECEEAEYFFTRDGSRTHSAHIKKTTLTAEVIIDRVPKRAEAVQDFVKRYARDVAYQKLVVRQLRTIIDTDVSAITVNPVFGSLWRAVCNDRKTDERQSLLDAFGRAINNQQDEGQRSATKAWLEESYDYSGEVVEAISGVAASDRFPCVYLDPTVPFEDAKFTRDELLDIGRSCDPRVLRRLGKALSRIVYVESVEHLPAHIAAAGDEVVPKIPLKLKSGSMTFWRVLLHVVLPGTFLGARPATLLAALVIRIGLRPLMRKAVEQMLSFKDKWNNVEVPETWSLGCLSLLLDADKARASQDHETVRRGDEQSLLLPFDRNVFSNLVSYKLLEANLDTHLHAQMPFTPEKSRLPMGKLKGCRTCHQDLSLSIMTNDGQCGLCAWNEYASATKNAEMIVDVQALGAQQPAWVECSNKACRVQYVVHNVSGLNVRPKCHYCRNPGKYPVTEDNGQGTAAPFVQCRRCCNRVICPLIYQPEAVTVDGAFTCALCASDQLEKAFQEVDVTAQQLIQENGTGWLVSSTSLARPFQGLSLFKTVSNAGLDSFSTMQILAGPPEKQLLQFQGKPAFNTQTLVRDELAGWVTKRMVEKGTCSLCFSDYKKDRLQRACGRRGCAQKVCQDCLRGWYGLNEQGAAINFPALNCPFCRRSPAAKVLASHGNGVHALANLTTAQREQGTWIYAWCIACDTAKPAVERVCTGDERPEIRRFHCEDCASKAEEGLSSATAMEECPRCSVLTEKTSGCNHITCPCGADWCFFCGEEHDAAGIYHHMSVAHGGYGIDGADDNPDDDGEEFEI